MKKKRITELNRLSVEEFKCADKIPLVVILDDVRSLNNIGSIFRAADAFRVEKVYLCGISASPPHPDIHKTALGAEFSVEWEHCSDVCGAISACRDKGYKICAIEQANGSVELSQFIISQDDKYAVVLGNEVKGVRQEAVNMCDECIEIAQYGTKHSLNVSITAGIVIWEFFNKMKKN